MWEWAVRDIIRDAQYELYCDDVFSVRLQETPFSRTTYAELCNGTFSRH